MEILALDVGEARVGIARASTAARLAEPLKTVKTKDAVDYLQDLIKEGDIQAAVVGLPRNLSGEETNQTRWVRAWVEQAKPKINRPLYWQDEALTSRVAAGRIPKSEFQNPNSDEHSLAAAMILQDFLDTPESERVKC